MSIVTHWVNLRYGANTYQYNVTLRICYAIGKELLYEETISTIPWHFLYLHTFLMHWRSSHVCAALRSFGFFQALFNWI